MTPERIQDSAKRVRLGEIARIVNGSGFPEHLQGKTNLPFPFLKVSDMNAPGAEVIVQKAANTVDDSILASIGAKTYPPGTIIFPKVGGALLTNKKRILGVHAAFDNNVMGVVPQAVDGEWLYYWMLNFDLKSIANTQALPSIRQSDVANLAVTLPPPGEQRRIAARLREQLAEADKARAAVQAQLDVARTLPAAHLRSVFSGDILTKWQIKPLGDVAEISGGVTLGRDLRGRPTRPVPYLRVANVKDGHLDLAHTKEVEATEGEIDACRLQFGDLLLTEGGDPDKLGRGSYWEEQLPECIHQNHIFRVRFDLAAFDPAFVASQVGSPYGKAYFLAHAKQTTGIATINRTVLSKYPLLAPPLSEQRALATRLKIEKEAAASLTAHLKDKLAALGHVCAALLREAFSGRC
jgi:type I restriction enzyme S subunit